MSERIGSSRNPPKNTKNELPEWLTKNNVVLTYQISGNSHNDQQQHCNTSGPPIEIWEWNMRISLEEWT